MTPKPLELTLHKRVDSAGGSAYRVLDPSDDGWDDWLTTDIVDEGYVQPKRLTDAELAAEYWRASGDCDVLDAGYGLEAWSSDLAEAHLRGEVIERFATTPSYDEQDNA